MAILQKNRKAAAGVGIAAAAAAVLALGAGTYAAFTDTETAPETTFAAGTLNLELGGSATAGPMTLNNIAPGQTRSNVLTLRNSGTVNGNVTLSFAVTGSENGCVEQEIEAGCVDGGAGQLLNTLVVTVNGQPYGTLAQLAAAGPQAGGPLAALGVNPVEIAVEMPVGVGNEVQSDTATLITTANLES